MLGMGPAATGDEIDPDLTNAGKIPVTELPGRLVLPPRRLLRHDARRPPRRLRARRVPGLGGGDLANWHTGAPDAIPAVGGAMDLAIGAKRVFVMMTLFAKDGAPKLVPGARTRSPGVGCVSRVYTDHAVFEIVSRSGESVRVLETLASPSRSC